MYGLQGVELMCVGYNTTAWAPQLWGIDPSSMTREEAYADAMFHHKLVCQANAYTNSSALLFFSPRFCCVLTQRALPPAQRSLLPLHDAGTTTACTRSSRAP